MIGRVNQYYESGWVLYRATSTTDAYGGVVNTYSSQAALTGRLRPLSGEYRLSADKETEFATHRFYCSPADIRVGDRLSKGGDIYEVKFAANVMDMGRFMHVDLEWVS